MNEAGSLSGITWTRFFLVGMRVTGKELGMNKETLRRLCVGGLWFITTYVYIFVNLGSGMPGFDGRGNPKLDMLFLIVLTCIFHKTINWILKAVESSEAD